MKERTTGEDIYQALVKSLLEFGTLNFDKCVCIATDGAPSMVGRQNGLVAKVKQLNSSIVAIYCIIHQENL